MMNASSISNSDEKFQIKSDRVDEAIRTKNIWLLRSLALSDGGLCHDANRQKAWPLLLEYACKETSIHENVQQDIKSIETFLNEKPDPSPIHPHPSSPCSVMDGSSNFDKDVSTIWLDVERWNPPVDHRSGLSIPEYRNLLAHVILQTLQTNDCVLKPLRYFQGFHILAGLVLNTYLHNSFNDLITMSLATIDAIHFLQKWICNTSLLNDVVREETIEPIVQRLRTFVLPLYYHFQSNEPPNNQRDEELYDLQYDEERNGLLVAQCLPWLLTMFGPHRSLKYDAKAADSMQSTHARMVDAVLASHPIYFPIYLCVTLLLLQPPNALHMQSMPESSSNIECVIQKTIDRMKATPPELLPQISEQYFTQMDCTALSSVPLTASHNAAIPGPTTLKELQEISCSFSNYKYQQHPASKLAGIQWVSLALWIIVGCIFRNINDFLIRIPGAGPNVIALIKTLHSNYLSLRYPRATVAMALWKHHGDASIIYQTMKRSLRSILRRAHLRKRLLVLLLSQWKSIKIYFNASTKTIERG